MEKGVVTRENIQLLIQGKIPWEEAKRLLQLKPKDKDRLWRYLEVLQELVPWDEQILLRISDRLYIVKKKDHSRVVKCECGYEYGDYRINWKLNALIYIRTTKEEVGEVFQPEEVVGPKPGWAELREYYCPGCGCQHSVEIVPPGYPPIFEFLPDIDRLYREMGSPLPDEDEAWFHDQTSQMVAQWAREEEQENG